MSSSNVNNMISNQRNDINNNNIILHNNDHSNNSNKDIKSSLSNRRDALITSAKTAVSTTVIPGAAADGIFWMLNRRHLSIIASDNGLVADIPMIRLRLPQGGLGREYVATKLKIQGQGPFDFMVDSGLTTEMITPHLVQSVGGIMDDTTATTTTTSSSNNSRDRNMKELVLG
jgi:Aspartyl protease